MGLGGVAGPEEPMGTPAQPSAILFRGNTCPHKKPPSLLERNSSGAQGGRGCLKTPFFVSLPLDLPAHPDSGETKIPKWLGFNFFFPGSTGWNIRGEPG